MGRAPPPLRRRSPAPGIHTRPSRKNIPNQCLAATGKLPTAVAKIAPPRMNLTPGYRD